MEAIVGGHEVVCSGDHSDIFGRLVGTCRITGDGDGLDVGGELVRQGWALAYRRYGRQYGAAEDEARIAKRYVSSPLPRVDQGEEKRKLLSVYRPLTHLTRVYVLFE